MPRPVHLHFFAAAKPGRECKSSKSFLNTVLQLQEIFFANSIHHTGSCWPAARPFLCEIRNMVRGFCNPFVLCCLLTSCPLDILYDLHCNPFQKPLWPPCWGSKIIQDVSVFSWAFQLFPSLVIQMMRWISSWESLRNLTGENIYITCFSEFGQP